MRSRSLVLKRPKSLASPFSSTMFTTPAKSKKFVWWMTTSSPWPFPMNPDPCPLSTMIAIPLSKVLFISGPDGNYPNLTPWRCTKRSDLKMFPELCSTWLCSTWDPRIPTYAQWLTIYSVHWPPISTSGSKDICWKLTGYAYPPTTQFSSNPSVKL